jgi:asparagine synthase (glutamine-hydrolysing)
MCGICGLFYKKNKEIQIETQIDKMLNSLYHRGPDDKNYYCTIPHKHAIGQTRLSIIDLELGKQPFIDKETNTAIVYNGELYNYKELRIELHKLGIQFTTNSDTEVVLKAYLYYGIKCLNKFVGMFAFIIYNNDGNYIIVRDRFGVKPLYYYDSQNVLIIASELKAIIETGLIETKPDMINLLMKLTYGYTIDNSTFIKDIKSLLPGEYGIFENGKFNKYFYYLIEDLPYNSLKIDFNEAKNEFYRLMNQSVESHLIADVKVTTSLSGGLDSSIVSTIANRIQAIESYCVGYDLPDDENYFANLLGNTFKIQNSNCISKLSEVSNQINKILYHLEDPLPHIQIATSFIGSSFVKKNLHSKVTLIGEGADELLAGYDRHKMAYNTNSWFKSKSIKKSLNEYRNMHHLLFEYNLGDIYEKEYSDSIDEFIKIEKNRINNYIEKSESPLQLILLCDIKDQLPNSQLMRIDKTFMANSVEARVPFLDHRLAEFLWNIPEKYKFGKNSKWIARQAFIDLLPKEIIYREKYGIKGTQNLITPWLDNGLKKILLEKVENGLKKRNIFKEKFINDLLAERLPNNYKVLLTLGFFEILYQTFIDKNSNQNI